MFEDMTTSCNGDPKVKELNNLLMKIFSYSILLVHYCQITLTNLLSIFAKSNNHLSFMHCKSKANNYLVAYI
jgi:hypothetical protein